ncbi:ABC transporter ATP-binding protein [Salinicoccus sp. ID82-1]|uniref:ABC transporter ATP-binding protein n=1 Tax=Salinicoccus cyprini TaxID=2493691 RepID=A0A558AU99_9STAP|nr:MULTISPECIES: ABC transporter ATP-binding protein [Salinicoccus]MCG1010813.1 ABC transporter ATP-binding protein [Salinicoccus sp. ID82-1]TVT27862.1 ABC transporter ATP-binding protein [Salinicoccus cyprini]
MDNKTSLKDFLELIRQTRLNKGLFAAGIFLTLIGTIGSLIVPLLTQSFIDGYDTELFSTGLIALIIAVFVLSAALDGVAYYILARIGQTIILRLRERVWDKFLKLPIRYFDQTKSGESVSRVVNDTAIIKDLITSHFPQLISGIISVIGAVIILFILDWRMSLIMFIAVPVSLVIIMPLGRKMSRISRALQDETAAFTGVIQETLSEMRLVKSFNGEAYERKRGRTGIRSLYGYGMKEATINAFLSPIMGTVMMFVIILIIGYGGLRVSEGTLSMGTMVAFLLYLFQIIMPMTMFAMFFTEYNKALGATERIIGILGKEEEGAQDNTLETSLDFKILAFDNVSFGYDPDKEILHQISLTANSNQKVAFVGPSGSGKSTIFALIERYYDVDAGSITVDGTDIRDIPLNTLRRQIGYVAQESAIISGTIRDNITYGLESHEYTEADVELAVRRSYSHEFIEMLDQGLDTEVGERGIKLSGGQRQRIGIARAFLKDPKLLMLDEATASLDSRSEKFVQEALDDLMQGRTVLVIAHRLSTIINSDRIFFLDNGYITGEGTHRELIENHTMYRIFTEQQFG